MLAALALVGPPSAYAQLTSVDQGAAATDAEGLMWANTVGTDLTWSSTGAAGSAQSWVATLNSTDYGGYDNWTLATGYGGAAANSTSNQLGDLFYTDCGNAPGLASVLNQPGKNCTALSAVSIALGSTTNGVFPGALFFSGSAYTGPGSTSTFAGYWWVFDSTQSGQETWNDDSQFGMTVGRGDALAVREAPEIDPASTGSGIALLLGGLAILRGRRAASSDAPR